MATTLKQNAKRRAERTRRRLKAVANGRLRLSVHRSDKNISAQIIDDAKGVTVASASSLSHSTVDADPVPILVSLYLSLSHCNPLPCASDYTTLPNRTAGGRRLGPH